MPNRGTIYNALGTNQYSQATTASFAVPNPMLTGGYVYSMEQHPGSVTAHNHLSLTNPTGSGKTILIAGVFISQVTIGAVSVTDALRGWLATNVAGGTLQPTNTIGKIRSTMPNPAGQIRTEGMTATLGAAWFNSPTLQATGASTFGFIHQVPATVAAGTLTLLPGESTVIRTESGSANTLWNLSIAWSEF
ncbi:hypothetical protein HWB05_gp150 [Streptomyces phage BRock]|uniref:Uncharacterized protein n=1 Tax=Streptomyces phage BRock TaxID=1913591 RepID=A0A1J0GW59_9CAUD|nr:hypothetical protein HWB05_gp150 [Streptomyces phage BRock]APC46412.1 hypothetical protein [Streptomyces phage BRock]